MTAEVENFAKMFEESETPVTKPIKNQFSVKEQKEKKQKKLSESIAKFTARNSRPNRGSTSRK